jgi:protein-tyrosine phosphatase
MSGFVDLHCHWIAAIDDGARTPEEGIAMLGLLQQAGFDTVVATPHMRPGMFDNDRSRLEGAYASMQPHLEEARRHRALPAVHLASEHFFDDIVFQRLVNGAGMPYPGRGAVLVEFSPHGFPVRCQARFFDLRRAGLVPVVAHPERYDPVWADDECLTPLLDAGAHLLLDVCAVVGKYGRLAQRAAEKLLEEEAYEAACSDAHRPQDVALVVSAIARLEALVGKEEAMRLLGEGPRGILETTAGPAGAKASPSGI